MEVLHRHHRQHSCAQRPILKAVTVTFPTAETRADKYTSSTASLTRCATRCMTHVVMAPINRCPDSNHYVEYCFWFISSTPSFRLDRPKVAVCHEHRQAAVYREHGGDHVELRVFSASDLHSSAHSSASNVAAAASGSAAVLSAPAEHMEKTMFRRCYSVFSYKINFRNLYSSKVIFESFLLVLRRSASSELGLLVDKWPSALTGAAACSVWCRADAGCPLKSARSAATVLSTTIREVFCDRQRHYAMTPICYRL